MSDNYGTSAIASELQVLELVYANELKKVGDSKLEFTVPLPSGLGSFILEVYIGSNYPKLSAEYEIRLISKHLVQQVSRENLNKLKQALVTLHDPEAPENISTAVEHLRENGLTILGLSDCDCIPNDESKTESLEPVILPTLYHGSVLTDRKSKFQAHFARIFTSGDAQMVLDHIRNHVKFSKATHPCIFAYTHEISIGKSSIVANDDGEGGASSYLENLLTTRNIKNAIIIVTRWFGGVQLGPDRFRHINSVAESLLNIYLPSNSTLFGTGFLDATNQILLSNSNSELTAEYYELESNGIFKKYYNWNLKKNAAIPFKPHMLVALFDAQKRCLWNAYTGSSIDCEE